MNKYFFLKPGMTTLAALLSALPTLALASSHDWSGRYYGSILSAGALTNTSHADYTNDGVTPSEGWSSNQFQGNVYNTINSMLAVDDGNGFPPSINTNDSMGPLANWLSRFTQTAKPALGTAFIGESRQIDNLVIGGEARFNFGNFGRSTSQSLSASTTKTGAFSDSEGAQITFTNYGSVLSGISSGITGFQGISYNAPVEQTGEQRNHVALSYNSSLIGRVGYAVGRSMLYATGGLAFAKGKATTTTTITESSSGSATITGGATTNFTATQTYNFSGQETKNLYGYTFGVGLEKVIIGSLIFRVDMQFRDLGSINVTGISSETTATYAIKQEMKGFNTGMGLVLKL